jgi:formate-dependent phosphoribosylglycinamide formyltransferase (GAR transformylase)
MNGEGEVEVREPVLEIGVPLTLSPHILSSSKGEAVVELDH